MRLPGLFLPEAFLVRKNVVPFKVIQPKTENEFKAYFKLRWTLLRAPWNQPEGSETDEIETQCFHLMAVDEGGDIIGVARLQFNSESEAQIRYMAVARSHQRQGVGHELIIALENHAATTAHSKIVLDAREPAVRFYQKSGYQVLEKSYLLFDEIQHFRMSKAL